MEDRDMVRRLATLLVGVVVVSAGARGAELEAGFRNPPASCQPTMGWFHSKAFEATLATCPAELRPAFDRALADGGLSTTPEEVRRMAAWQALVDASVITQPGLPARPPAQPYKAFAPTVHTCIARLVYLCSTTKAEGGIFTQAKPAHGITIYPPAPDLYLARRRLGEADVYLAVSQTGIDTLVTVTFPRAATPELCSRSVWAPTRPSSSSCASRQASSTSRSPPRRFGSRPWSPTALPRGASRASTAAAP
jgi:hypothetical protein